MDWSDVVSMTFDGTLFIFTDSKGDSKSFDLPSVQQMVVNWMQMEG